MNRISRKGAMAGAAGLLTLAALGGIVGHNAVHAASPPAITQKAPDTDNVQSGSQQQDVGGTDTAEATTAESTAPEASAPAGPDGDTVQSGSQTDTP